jgi:hypothetical protein
MSPTYGNPPPALGAADLHVDPQALWDVGLAVQRVRDSLTGFHQAVWLDSTRIAASWMPDDIPEMFQAWRQISVATAGPPNGLTKQVEGLIGVLDDMMMHLRDAILSYVISEAESQRRLERLKD